MRLHTVRAAAIFLSLFVLSGPVKGQEKTAEAKYKFRKGDVLKFVVTSTLEATQAGTHQDFLMQGNEKPLSWTVNGTFENHILEVNEDGSAVIERRVKSIDSFGNVQNPAENEKFKFSWNRDKDKDAPDESKITSLMDRFIANMIANPFKFVVDTEGNTIAGENLDMKRLVMRRGMMYWPVKANEASWISHEDIALPVLHDKIKLEFKNTVKADATRTGFKVREILAPVSLKESAKAGFHAFELDFTVSGNAKVDFDMTNGRLNKLDLVVSVQFSGKAPVAGGGEGNIRGTATYRETQVYQD